MFKSNNAIVIFIAILVILVVLQRYLHFMVATDYLLYGQTSCNTESEECFMSKCTPDQDCSDKPYKKVIVQKNIAHSCLLEHTCEDYRCEKDTVCQIIYCSESTLDEGEKCFNENE